MSEKRVNDETCLLIQDLMANWEKQIDELSKMVALQKRDSSSIHDELKELHKHICRVHRAAGTEMER